jgi:hypothetical protein
MLFLVLVLSKKTGAVENEEEYENEPYTPGFPS